MNERLYRSRDDRIIAGVAGGVAERFRMDPSLVRIVWVILIPATAGAALALYVVMAFVVPEEPPGESRWSAWEHQSGGYQWPDPAAPGTGTSTAGPPGAGTAAVGDAASGPAIAVAEASPGGAAVAAGSAGAAVTAAEANSGTAPASPTPWTTTPLVASPPNPAWPMDPRAAREAGRDARRAARSEGGTGSGAILFGLILIVVGGYFFARAYLPDIDVNRAWPIILVVLGAVLLVGSFRRGSDHSG
jgi:phage shock protein C